MNDNTHKQALAILIHLSEMSGRFVSNNTKLGKKISSVINSGELVSDIIVSDLIEKIISDSKYQNRIVFDGYPRNLNQAKNLDNLLKKYKQKIDVVLKLSVSLETIKKEFQKDVI